MNEIELPRPVVCHLSPGFDFGLYYHPFLAWQTMVDQKVLKLIFMACCCGENVGRIHEMKERPKMKTGDKLLYKCFF